MSDRGHYEQRFYRRWMQAPDLKRFCVSLGESDLMVLADEELLDEARASLAEVRRGIERYIGQDPSFASALTPRPVEVDAPEVVRAMARAGEMWGVGPMAAVAGAVAERVGRRLLAHVPNVVVENGGDVFVRMDRPVTLRLYAGEDSPFRDRIGFRVRGPEGLGVCTSSGVVGPSLSMGRADAVVAVSRDTAVADAAATSLANRIAEPGDVDAVVREVERDGGLDGLIACKSERIGLWGDLELVDDRGETR
jgi:hypothetical protein